MSQPSPVMEVCKAFVRYLSPRAEKPDAKALLAELLSYTNNGHEHGAQVEVIELQLLIGSIVSCWRNRL